MADLAHVAELVLRSLNGLEERLHHSYALYGLLSSDRFVTVEVYILPLACLIAVLPLQVRLSDIIIAARRCHFVTKNTANALYWADKMLALWW